MLQARRGGAGGADILVCKIFLRSTVASMETYSTLCVSLCMCVCVCVAALMQYVKATRSIYSKYNNNNKSDNDSSNNNNDKYTKHEYGIHIQTIALLLPKNRQKQPVRKHLQQGHQGYISCRESERESMAAECASERGYTR